MCRHQTLYYDDNTGYVIRCMVCENFQLGYGNILITLSAADFASLRNCVMNVHDHHQYSSDVHTDVKSFFIPTPCDGLKFLLTHKELKALNNMLDMADTEWKSQQLMDMFNKV